MATLMGDFMELRVEVCFHPFSTLKFHLSTPNAFAGQLILPVFRSNSWMSRMRFRIVGLVSQPATVFCIRRLQLELAAVPGTLNRSFRASRSVIMTMAIHDSLRKSASITRG